MYQVLFFNATHQVKAIAIGVSEVNPLVEISEFAKKNIFYKHVYQKVPYVLRNKTCTPIPVL